MIRLCAFSDEAASGLSDQIDALVRNGIRMTELRSVGGVTVSKLAESDAPDVRRRLDDAGISVWALGSQYGKVSLGEGFERETLFSQLRRLCRMALALGTDKIRMFSFYDAHDKSEEVFSLLSESVKIAAGYGVSLYHENELEIFGDTTDNVLALHENVPGLFFVCDGANFVHNGESADDALDKLFDISSYFHVKDTLAATGEHVPAGEGDAGIERLIARLDDSRNVTLTLEPHLVSFEAFAAIDRTELKTKRKFNSNAEAFDTAAAALRALLEKHGKRFA